MVAESPRTSFRRKRNNQPVALSLRSWRLVTIRAVSHAFDSSPAFAHVGEDLAGPLKVQVLAFLGYSPPGLRLAVGNGELLSVLDAATGRPEVRVKHDDPNNPLQWQRATQVNAVEWSAGAVRVVTASVDGWLRCFDAAGNLVDAANLGPRNELHGEERGDAERQKGLTTVAYSPDGRAVAVGSSDGRLRVLEVATWTELFAARFGSSTVHDIRYSRCGSFLATGTADGHVRVFEASGAVKLDVVVPSARSVLSVSFSPDADRVAVGTHDGVLRILDLTTGEFTHEVRHTGTWRQWLLKVATGESFIAIGLLIVIVFLASHLPTCHAFIFIAFVIVCFILFFCRIAWESNWTRREVRAAWSPCGTRIATVSSEEVRFVNADTGEVNVELAFRLEAHCIAWSPDGNELAVGTDALNGGRVRIIDSLGRLTRDLRCDRVVRTVAWSP